MMKNILIENSKLKQE